MSTTSSPAGHVNRLHQAARIALLLQHTYLTTSRDHGKSLSELAASADQPTRDEVARRAGRKSTEPVSKETWDVVVEFLRLTEGMDRQAVAEQQQRVADELWRRRNAVPV